MGELALAELTRTEGRQMHPVAEAAPQLGICSVQGRGLTLFCTWGLVCSEPVLTQAPLQASCGPVITQGITEPHLVMCVPDPGARGPQGPVCAAMSPGLVVQGLGVPLGVL